MFLSGLQDKLKQQAQQEFLVESYLICNDENPIRYQNLK